MTVTPPPFLVFLNAGLEKGTFEADDELGAILPLMRQTLALHEQGLVDPLDGLSGIRTNDEGRLVLAEETPKPAQRNIARVDTVQQPASAAIEIVGEARQVLEVGEGALRVNSLDIGRQGDAISRPIFLPGYRSWEHAVEHHDEVTDVFSLGMLLASLACGLDLSDPDDLELFVNHRSNLFALNQRLHPVIASVIVQMTELNRHRRAQDLRSLIGRLANYRDQPAELDLNRIPGFKESGVQGRRKVVQTHLRDRLFDMSRRNRLIHFKPTLQTLNLTVASVPLVLDYRNIRPDQLFTWHGGLAAESPPERRCRWANICGSRMRSTSPASWTRSSAKRGATKPSMGLPSFGSSSFFCAGTTSRKHSTSGFIRHCFCCPLS